MLNQYKYWIAAAAFLLYSWFLWNTSSTVTENSFLKEKAALQQAVIDEKDRKQNIADDVGKRVDASLRVYQQNNLKQQKELLNEMAKEPKYNECINTPAVVQYFDDKVRRANEAIGK